MPRTLIPILAVLSLAALGCRLPAVGIPAAPPPAPPFDPSSLSVTSETVYYGEGCDDDQPTSFTVTASQLPRVQNPDKVTLQWAYVLPDGTVTQWENVQMSIPSAAGVYEATVEIDAATADFALEGQAGEIIYQVEAGYGRMTYYGIHTVGGELIDLEFCGE